MLALLLFALVVAVIVGLQIRAVMLWRGIWRKLAAAPLLVLAADALLILVQTSYDPTSHNLWPLEMMMFGAAGLPFVGLLWLMRLAAKA